MLHFSSPNIEDPSQSKLAKLNENDAANEHGSGANEILVTNAELLNMAPKAPYFMVMRS